jgi:ubiquinone/menaquinone biosynthesis C-methylase UbiE
MAIHDAAARGFEAAADAYERGRPPYSAEAIEHLVAVLGLGAGRRVLDLAAGTGKLTRALVPSGADLVAVEPVAAMRARLAEAVPSAQVLDGTAEAIPLPDGAVDAVVVGQAFHWFDGERALREIHRVLRPGGGLGLIWQSRDPQRPWQQRLEIVINRLASREPRFRSGEWRRAFEATALFEPLREAQFRHVQRGEHQVIVDRVASISYVAAAPPSARNAVLDDVRELLATDPETASAEVIELPYRTRVYWTSRPDQPRS